MPENRLDFLEGTGGERQTFVAPLADIRLEDAQRAWAPSTQSNALREFPSADSLLSWQDPTTARNQSFDATPQQQQRFDVDQLRENAVATAGDTFDRNNLIRVEVNRENAGTAADFRAAMDNSLHHVGQTRGADADRTLVSFSDLGPSSSRDPRPMPVNTPYFNNVRGRYVNTERAGWIDMAHFLFYAGGARRAHDMGVPDQAIEAAGEAVGNLQEMTDPRRSRYSPEDIPSDRRGIEFALHHFDPRSNLTLGQQVENYLNNVLHARRPEQAPDWSRLPAQDRGDRRT